MKNYEIDCRQILLYYICFRSVLDLIMIATVHMYCLYTKMDLWKLNIGLYIQMCTHVHTHTHIVY